MTIQNKFLNRIIIFFTLIFLTIFFYNVYFNIDFLKSFSFFFKLLLGSTPMSPFSGNISANFTCVDSEIYCRSLGYEFYKFIFVKFNFTSKEFSFVQIFFYIYLSFRFAKEFSKFIENKFFFYLFFFILLFNLKVIKLVIIIADDSLSIILLLSILFLTIKNFRKFSLKTFMIISFLIGFSIIVRPANIYLVILLFFFLKQIIIKYKLKKIIFSISLLILIIPSIIEDKTFYHINKFERQTPLWADLQGKLIVMSNNKFTNPFFSNYDYVVKVHNNIYQKNKNSLNKFFLEHWYENSTISIYSNSKIAGGIREFENIFAEYKIQNIHPNQIIKQSILASLKENKINLLNIILNNYFGIWFLRELPTSEQAKKINNFLSSQDFSTKDHYIRVLSSNTHNSNLVYVAKIFIFLIFLISIFFFIYFVTILISNYLLKRNLLLIKKQVFLGFVASILLNCYFLVVALGSLVQARLLLNVWPVIVLLILTFFYFLYEKILLRKK